MYYFVPGLFGYWLLVIEFKQVIKHIVDPRLTFPHDHGMWYHLIILRLAFPHD
ncbi:hypothetical protein Hanom_Chr02g00114991 [Helianthus anomalus]